MNFLIELLFPRRCPICDRPVDKMGKYICKNCKPKIRYVKSPYCFKCGKPLKDNAREYCTDCQKAAHLFDRGRAMYEYETVKEAIYRFKYEGRKEYATFFGRQMAGKFSQEISEWKPDALIPVPLHKDRLKERGYNQSALLARELGNVLNIPVNEEIVCREKPTVPQKELNGKERENNLKNAFKIRQNDVKLKTIIVVDDIYTTGSTMNAIAQCLKEAGVQKVFFVSLAVGRGI